MQTSRTLLGQVRRALLVAFLFGGCSSLLALVLPLCLFHALESAIPSASLHTLALLGVMATIASLARFCVLGARDRILLRAGLWIEHALGRQILDHGAQLGRRPADVADDARAVEGLAGGLREGAITPALEAPWVVLSLAALALLHPVMAVAVVPAVALLGTALVQTPRLRRMAEQRERAFEDVRTWWLAACLSSSLPAAAPGEWEVLDRTRIARTWALGRRVAMLLDFARLAWAGALMALVAAGAWLVVAKELTVPALIAGVLIGAQMLAPLTRLLGSLPASVMAAAAYHRLMAVERDAGSRAARDPSALPRLHIRGPLALGIVAVLLFVVVGIGTAAVRLGDVAGLVGGSVFEGRLQTIAYPRRGGPARVHQVEGALVQAGDLIVTLDTGPLDARIAALKAQADTAKQQLALLRQEAAAAVAASELMAAGKPGLAALEQRTAELEQEAQWLLARIAAAEDDLAGSELRAPASGRLVRVREADARGVPGVIEITIATSDRRLLGRLLDPVRSQLWHSPAVAQLAAPHG